MNAFVAKKDVLAGLTGAWVLLVDDALTTGSTAAAQALVQAGTAEGFLSTFARACPYV